MRTIAIPTAFLGWLYGWYLLRGVRNEYAPGDLGPLPAWLVLLLASLTFVTIATAIAAGMRAGIWPLLAVTSGLAMVAAVLASQYSVMHDFVEARGGRGQQPVLTLPDVVNAALRDRAPLDIVLVSGIPTILVLAGIGQWLRRPRRYSAQPAQKSSD